MSSPQAPTPPTDTLREALEHIARYGEIVDEIKCSDTSESGGLTAVSVPLRYLRQAVDMARAALASGSAPAPAEPPPTARHCWQCGAPVMMISMQHNDVSGVVRAAVEALTPEQLFEIARAVAQTGYPMMQWPSVLRGALLKALSQQETP
jgi:hypothetical protein